MQCIYTVKARWKTLYMHVLCFRFQWPNFASDIGGILGLWLGLSILSAFEFFELASDFVVFLCIKCSRRKEAAEDSESPPPPYSSADSRNRKTITSAFNTNDDFRADPKKHHRLGFV